MTSNQLITSGLKSLELVAKAVNLSFRLFVDKCGAASASVSGSWSDVSRFELQEKI